ncbi:hypothetical protein [Halovenus marina]|uniref:hypothetical protein n=1 Tax=Halovenus marina TaxID=3396621 RepID=UPI003F57521D
MTAVDQFVDTLDDEVERIRAGEAEDIERVKHKRPPNGNRLVVMVGAVVETRTTHRDTLFVRELLTADQYDLDLSAVKPIAVSRFEGQISTYRNRFDLTRTAELLEELVEMVPDIDSDEAFLSVMKATQVYIQFLRGHFYSQVPWHDLSVTYEGRMVVDELYETKR